MNVDCDLENADWPKRTPDRLEDLESSPEADHPNDDRESEPE